MQNGQRGRPTKKWPPSARKFQKMPAISGRHSGGGHRLLSSGTAPCGACGAFPRLLVSTLGKREVQCGTLDLVALHFSRPSDSTQHFHGSHFPGVLNNAQSARRRPTPCAHLRQLCGCLFRSRFTLCGGELFATLLNLDLYAPRLVGCGFAIEETIASSDVSTNPCRMSTYPHLSTLTCAPNKLRRAFSCFSSNKLMRSYAIITFAMYS